jgi:tetrahydromethanopterin S-methyltransferase subunit E
VGWLQAAIWQFTTGRGAAKQWHQTLFGYGINVFNTGRQAQKAIGMRPSSDIEASCTPAGDDLSKQ